MLKPQDIVVLCKLVAGAEDAPWRQQDLAGALGLSQAEIHKALARAEHAGLYLPSQRKVARRALHEFLVHGLK